MGQGGVWSFSRPQDSLCFFTQFLLKARSVQGKTWRKGHHTQTPIFTSGPAEQNPGLKKKRESGCHGQSSIFLLFPRNRLVSAHELTFRPLEITNALFSSLWNAISSFCEQLFLLRSLHPTPAPSQLSDPERLKARTGRNGSQRCLFCWDFYQDLHTPFARSC